MRAIDPATTADMKPAAPISSDRARPPLFIVMATKVEKISGLPFPKAKMVTPARLSLSPSTCAMDRRFGVKKSDAAVPMVVKRMASHATKPVMDNGLATGDAQKYN